MMATRTTTRAPFPLLQKYNMVGHFFIISDFVNQGRPGYMTWPQIEEMAAAGQRFGSHSRDHPKPERAKRRLPGVAGAGEQRSDGGAPGLSPAVDCLPGGAVRRPTIAVFKSADYWGGLTTQQGATHTLAGIFELNRVRVRGSYTAEELGRLLVLDW